MWKVVETEAREVEIRETKREREKERKRKKREKREQKKKKKEKKEKPKKKRMMKVKKVIEEWEIWDEEKEVAKLEEGAKNLVLKYFHKWIHIFGKKQSKIMSTRKLWDHAIKIKEEFVL